MSLPLVLIVDDEAILLLAARKALSMALGAGFRCETALSAESALTVIDEAGGTVAAVVSDWRMPGMRGDEFLRKVRALGSSTCLILLTGYADQAAVSILEQEIQLAAVYQKPCQMARVADTIKTCLGAAAPGSG